MFTLSNGLIEVTVNPEHGAQITHVADRNGRNALAWYDWSSPARASDGERYYDSRLDWLSDYRGGWQETVPNAGIASEVNGVRHPFHGEASISPWTVQESSGTNCRLTFATRLPLEIERRMWLGADAPILYIEGTATNTGDSSVSFVWGHHPVFPAEPGSHIDLPPGTQVRHEGSQPSDLIHVDSTWPNGMTHSGEHVDLSTMTDESVHRLAYLHGHREGWAAIRQPAGTSPSIGMAWDIAVYPHIWFWTMRHTPEFPWYGRAAVVALEPQTAMPFDGLAGAIARDQAHRLEPGESISTWLTFRLLDDDQTTVAGVRRDGLVTYR